MKIDIANIIYTVFMILLAFISAIVITKTISKYTQKDKKEDNNDEL